MPTQAHHQRDQTSHISISPRRTHARRRNRTTSVHSEKGKEGIRESYHGIEIREPIDQGRGLGEPLLEGVAEVVGRVGGDDEDGGSDGGEQDREDRAARGLPDAALAADEHPLEGLLLQDVLHRRLRQIRRHWRAEFRAAVTANREERERERDALWRRGTEHTSPTNVTRQVIQMV